MIDFWRTSYGSNDIDNANLLNKIFYSIFTRNLDSIDRDSLTSDVLSSYRYQITNYEVYNS